MRTALLILLLAVTLWRGSKAADPSPALAGYVVVQGEGMSKPERLPYTPGLTVMVAIVQVHAQFFNLPRKVLLVRGEKVIPLDLKKIRAHSADDPEVEPGDILQLPQTMF